ncbi:hypothetical protein KFL_002600060 [Klebsormidium nitens]|uniref:EF-hand domain-containing protein n=1 Tax=Klebsormidium nitens TaxID=105231 RepID=A0A1Y1ICU3_KLENI|nr:hypothetical protein KFL_002600060 [Klebsormidium nitens]|eukprot:GAQ85898.1 hypothetical protein KFL_002600060 [Klebsormidium nitens]
MVEASSLLLQRTVGRPRAFKASPTSSLEDTVQATLSSLPDELVDELGMTELGEEDTLAQRTRKLQYLKRQEELIKAEEERAKKEEEEKKTEEGAKQQAERDLALEEMKTATAKGLGFDTEAEAPLAHTVARAKAIDQKKDLCKLSEALAVLASASSVSKERTEFLNLVNKEIEMYNRMVEKEGTDGEEEAKRLFFEAKKEVDRAAHEGEEDGGAGPSQALIKRVDSLLHKLEKEIDDVDAKIGDRWRILDRDYDGKVSPDEVAAAAAFLKSELGEEPVQQLIANLAKDKDGKILVEDIVKLGTMAEAEEQKKQQESSSG